MDARRFALLLAPPLAVGAFLRLYRLGAQVLGGDELHMARLLFDQPLAGLLTTYQVTDVSLPLMGLLRVQSDLGIPLGEWHFRAPSILCGGLLLVLAPLALRPRIGARAALALAWLLALSPLLVFYSRFARSYAPIVLFSFAAAEAFFRWWRTRRSGWAVAYVVCAALAVYLHLGAAPFVVAPFAFAALEWLRGDRRGADLRRLAIVGTAWLGALALFLVPSAASLQSLWAFQRAAQAQLPPGWSPDGLLHLTGSSQLAVALAFFAFAARGLWRLCRPPETRGNAEGWGAYSAVVALGGAAGIAWLTSGTQPRYVIVALPFLLAWLAVGLVTPLPGLPRIASWVPTGALLLALVATGPLADPRLRQSSFMHHNDFLLFQHALPPADPGRVSTVYAELRGDGPIVEFPWIPSWHASRALPLAQQQHGREVRVSSPFDWLNDPRLALRNAVHPDPDSILASDADAVVLHRDLDAEERALAPDWMPLADPLPGAAERRREVPALALRLERRLGPPDHADALALAWDLSDRTGSDRGEPPQPE